MSQAEKISFSSNSEFEKEDDSETESISSKTDRKLHLQPQKRQRSSPGEIQPAKRPNSPANPIRQVGSKQKEKLRLVEFRGTLEKFCYPKILHFLNSDRELLRQTTNNLPDPHSLAPIRKTTTEAETRIEQHGRQ